MDKAAYAIYYAKNRDKLLQRKRDRRAHNRDRGLPREGLNTRWLVSCAGVGCGNRTWSNDNQPRLCAECKRVKHLNVMRERGGTSAANSLAQLRANAAREVRQGRYCLMCEGMSWRRPESGACECGEVFSPEVIDSAMCMRKTWGGER